MKDETFFIGRFNRLLVEITFLEDSRRGGLFILFLLIFFCFGVVSMSSIFSVSDLKQRFGSAGCRNAKSPTRMAWGKQELKKKRPSPAPSIAEFGQQRSQEREREIERERERRGGEGGGRGGGGVGG